MNVTVSSIFLRMWECLLLISNSRRKNQRRDIFYFVVFGVSKEIEINKKKDGKGRKRFAGATVAFLELRNRCAHVAGQPLLQVYLISLTTLHQYLKVQLRPSSTLFYPWLSFFFSLDFGQLNCVPSLLICICPMPTYGRKKKKKKVIGK